VGTAFVAPSLSLLGLRCLTVLADCLKLLVEHNLGSAFGTVARKSKGIIRVLESAL
jgi:hypothetical protein